MIQFVCDTCGKVKAGDDLWILGLGADQLGVTSAIREVDILSSWNDEQSRHPLAVHFCSEKCKNKYMAKAFATKISA